jgi:LacI family transcriptional regulator
MQQSTLKKLSEVLGISISTVSRALKDHPDISVATKTKVKELARAMEYEPNAYAVQLRTRQSNVLGILVPSITNFFYDSFIASVEEEARANGYSVLIMQSGDSAVTEAESLQIFRKNMVMGLFAAVTIETDDMSQFDKMEYMDVPVVFVDRIPQGEKYYKVSMADEEAARMAANTIAEAKKTNVLALFGHPHLSLTKLRKEAFETELKTKAPQTKITIDYPDTIEPSYNIAIKELKNKKHDVVFCMGDLILMGVMKAIHELNLKVPQDISVISISNGFIPSLYNPKITYIETSGYKLGKLAFTQMMGRLKKETVSENVCVGSSLINGGSL